MSFTHATAPTRTRRALVAGVGAILAAGMLAGCAAESLEVGSSSQPSATETAEELAPTTGMAADVEAYLLESFDIAGWQDTEGMTETAAAAHENLGWSAITSVEDGEAGWITVHLDADSAISGLNTVALRVMNEAGNDFPELAGVEVVHDGTDESGMITRAEAPLVD